MKPTFLNHDIPLITSMVRAAAPEKIKYLMDKSVSDGAEAFGIEFSLMKKEYRKPEVYKDLFSYANGLHVYVTNYRHAENEGKTDDILAKELLELADCGATLCDVMGDFFDIRLDEMAVNEVAIQKQMDLICQLHEKGAEVIMSSHIFKFTPARRVVEIALEQQRRGADICKIVVGADNMEQQIENLRIINLLKSTLKIPFLFLSSGESHLMRRIGGEIGCCTYLCMAEYDEFSTNSYTYFPPLVKNIKAIRDNIRKENNYESDTCK